MKFLFDKLDDFRYSARSQVMTQAAISGGMLIWTEDDATSSVGAASHERESVLRTLEERMGMYVAGRRVSPAAITFTADVIDEDDLKLLHSEFQKSRQMKAQRVQWYNFAHTSGMVRQQEDLESLGRSFAELSRMFNEQGQMCKSLIAAQETMLLALTGQATARVCLHEGFVGVIEEVSAEQITVQYDRKDDPNGPSVMQRYDRHQFLTGCSPQEGDEVEAHVFVVAVGHPSTALPTVTPVPADDPYEGFSHRWQNTSPAT